MKRVVQLKTDQSALRFKVVHCSVQLGLKGLKNVIPIDRGNKKKTRYTFLEKRGKLIAWN